MSSKSAGAKAYDIIVGAVRVGTNLLAAAVWWGILSGVIALFTAANMWEGASQGFLTALKWSFTDPVGIIVTVVFAVLGIIHAVRLAVAESQYGILGFFGFLLDNTWALPNTVLGSIFATVTLGISVDKSASRGSGRLILSSGLHPDYDTTFGSVTAGTIVKRHELQHVIQSWLFGPFFYPIFAVNYLINLTPYWWLLKLVFNIYPNAPIDNFWRYSTFEF